MGSDGQGDWVDGAGMGKGGRGCWMRLWGEKRFGGPRLRRLGLLDSFLLRWGWGGEWREVTDGEDVPQGLRCIAAESAAWASLDIVIGEDEVEVGLDLIEAPLESGAAGNAKASR